ncbi:hypothetical protein [Streptomyces mangrovi]|uniref:hypothetical protein n=1 Tax=Streptomyces mangrovi TaxID=1206892 RepID=UPI00399CD40F
MTDTSGIATARAAQQHAARAAFRYGVRHPVTRAFLAAAATAAAAAYAAGHRVHDLHPPPQPLSRAN